MNMQTYRKWTARVAVVVLVFTVLFLVALVPLHAGKGAGTIWPLSHRFGPRHALADMEVALGWILFGVSVLILGGYQFYQLLKRAEWVS